MITLLRLIREDFRQRAQRRRFPLAVLHRGVVLDSATTLGRNTVLFNDVKLSGSKVGHYTYIQSKAAAFNAEIGPFCSIAQEVVIGLVDHPMRFISTSPVFYDNSQPLPQFFIDRPLEKISLPRTEIGADTWIGQRAMIKAGVKIGVGAVVGAGALVTRDVPPYTIVIGSPAKPIRQRFADAVCERLLASQWWTRNDLDLLQFNRLYDDPLAFLARLENDR
jgi:acetyltransferase-like isoleucine patch superfamily enzyme